MRVVVVAAIAACYGCGPTAKTTVESMTVFGNETAKAKDSIDNSVRSLDTLVNSQPADLKNNFDAYSKAVSDLDDQSKVVKANADKMRSNGDVFFKEWEGSSDISPERRSQLSASYDKIKQDMAGAKDAFGPFMASLKDIQSYLSLDLSVKGINSMAPMVAKAKDNSNQVKSQLDDVLMQLNSVRGMLSTTK
ncbi:MAG TPA: DUF2959 family protein [Humisphaera sp.]|jgi:hypothetical protein|nr:DUF2959 family protein [Humisphaera sp.]